MVEEKLMKTNPSAYCERVCLKMGYYVQTLLNKEILAMNVDFFQDDNGLIWFFFANKIYIRESK